MSRRDYHQKINKWLLWGVIVLCALLLLWLSIYLYFGAEEGGADFRMADTTEQVQE